MPGLDPPEVAAVADEGVEAMKEAEIVVAGATGAGMVEGVGMATGAAVDTTDVKDIIPHPVEEDITTSLPIKE